jgi:tetrahydromethanopterin S-methyltransferase subunit E
MNYNNLINKLFYWCVSFLKVWSKNLGMTYEEINIWLFVVIQPLIIILLIFYIISIKIKSHAKI